MHACACACIYIEISLGMHVYICTYQPRAKSYYTWMAFFFCICTCTCTSFSYIWMVGGPEVQMPLQTKMASYILEFCQHLKNSICMGFVHLLFFNYLILLVESCMHGFHITHAVLISVHIPIIHISNIFV